jgi:hypothetical protein
MPAASLSPGASPRPCRHHSVDTPLIQTYKEDFANHFLIPSITKYLSGTVLIDSNASPIRLEIVYLYLLRLSWFDVFYMAGRSRELRRLRIRWSLCVVVATGMDKKLVAPYESNPRHLPKYD